MPLVKLSYFWPQVLVISSQPGKNNRSQASDAEKENRSSRRLSCRGYAPQQLKSLLSAGRAPEGLLGSVHTRRVQQKQHLARSGLDLALLLHYSGTGIPAKARMSLAANICREQAVVAQRACSLRATSYSPTVPRALAGSSPLQRASSRQAERRTSTLCQGTNPLSSGRR